MKNLLIYINPQKNFDKEHSVLVKIQIDNSLSLGWKKEDILLFTNFDYEYRGIKSRIVSDDNFCPFRPLSTKTITVSYLLEHGMLEKGEVYWVHDFDAFQNRLISEEEIELGKFDVAFTDYGWSTKWCLGSYFFKESAKDIFKMIKDGIYEIQNEDERAFVALTNSNKNNINERFKKLNITYNFGIRKIGHNYSIAVKPIKVVHFHPGLNKAGINTTDAFMYGKNEVGVPLMDERLTEIFHSNGIK